MNKFCLFVSLLATLSPAVHSISVTDIQGPGFQSPYANQVVSNITALVTAKGSSGFYISGTAVSDIRRSNGLYVYSTYASVLGKVAVGDLITLSGTVSEYRSASYPNYLYLTELIYPANITVLSSNNAVTPLVLGKDRSPPTEKLSALDVGKQGWLSVPNNVSLVEAVNATLQPNLYGLDFWESLEGMLVKIPSPTAIDFQTSYSEFWVHGDWKVTGKNGRGGLTITLGSDGLPDANPEAVIIGSPLDGTKNPKVAVGFGLTDIVGVVTYQYGFYYVLPLTAPTVISTPDTTIPVTTVTASDSCTITFGDYNVENMTPTSKHIPTVADHIATYLKTPDIMFIQEIQDNSGATNDGTVSGNATLTALVNAIAAVSDVKYSFVEIAPVDGADGGQPGGNIRTAYLYKPEKLSLVTGAPAGGALDKVEVKGSFGFPTLNYNPGRIDPTNSAWNATRKPLVAEWKTKWGFKLFTINVHLSSKGGSSSSQGDARPPVNSPVATRTAQVASVATFVKSLLAKNLLANIIIAGDFNEYSQTASVLAPLNNIGMKEIDEVAKIPAVERYTYVYDQNSQQLDHVFISPALSWRKLSAEHIHVNNWGPLLSARVSDHDPTVGKVRVCLI